MKRLITKRNAIILIIIFGIAGGVLIGYLQTTSQKSTENKQNLSEEDTANLPKLENPKISSSYAEVNQEYQISANFPNNLLLPKSLPIYRVENSTIEKDVAQIAKNLGFTVKAIKSTNYTGEDVYSFYDGYKTLEILSNQRIINLNTGVFPKDPIPVPPSNDAVKKAVTDFLRTGNLINENDNLEITNVELYQEDEYYKSNSSKPNIGIRATLTEKVDGFTLIGGNSESGNIEAFLNSDLKIMSLRMMEIPQITKLDTYPLKTNDEILNSLKDATLQNLDISSPDEFYSKTIGTVTVNQIEVSYIQTKEGEQTLLEPVFLIKGTAFYNNGTKSSVTLQLPAISSQFFK